MHVDIRQRGDSAASTLPLDQNNPLLCQHDGTAACPACLVRAARELVAASDALDHAQARALAAWGEGYRTGAEATEERAHSEGRAEAIAEIKAVHDGLADTWGRMAPDVNPWLVLCGSCRRNGRRGGCRDCRDGDRSAFGLPHPDDFPGLGDVTGITAARPVRGAA